MYEGPEHGRCLIDGLLAREELANCPLAYSARADLCRWLGRLPEARALYQKALALARQEPERRFLSGRLEELKEKTGSAVDFPSARRLQGEQSSALVALLAINIRRDI